MKEVQFKTFRPRVAILLTTLTPRCFDHLRLTKLRLLPPLPPSLPFSTFFNISLMINPKGGNSLIWPI